MEQQEITVDPQYLRGFNSGYLLAKHEPELAAQLSAHPNEQNQYFNGFVGGKAEYDKEAREWAKSFSKGICLPVKTPRLRCRGMIHSSGARAETTPAEMASWPMPLNHLLTLP